MDEAERERRIAVLAQELAQICGCRLAKVHESMARLFVERAEAMREREAR